MLWERYYGHAGSESPLPSSIKEIMASPCPFCAEKQIKDTHLLALIPSHVGGKALTLDYLGELIQSPRGGVHGTQYRGDWHAKYVRPAIGSQSPDSSYWVLMTRDVLEGSRSKSYQDQCALVARHQGYTVPGVLEAAVVMLLHHVRSGERLYSDSPLMYTRCRESVQSCQRVVGDFSSGGLHVFNYYDDDSFFGVAGLRKF